MATKKNTVAANSTETVATNETKRYDVARLNSFSTMSAKIRYLQSCGLSTGAIAKELGVRYQHVRNVLIFPVSKPKESIVAAPAIEPETATA